MVEIEQAAAFLFKRADKQKIAEVNEKILKHEREIASIKNKIEGLKIRADELRTEFFCGYEIVHEHDRVQDTGPAYNDRMQGGGRSYMLVVKVRPGFRIAARAYPNAHDHGKTFVANLEVWGVYDYIPDWFQSEIKFNIKDYETAKTYAIEGLRHTLHVTDTQQSTEQAVSA